MKSALAESSVSIRDDLVHGMDQAWRNLCRPGTWWTGAERAAIAAEARHAGACAYCATCKESVSPFGVDGSHGALPETPAHAVDTIHRLVNDPGRLTHSWYDETIKAGLSEGEYVETISIVAMMLSMDTVFAGLGIVPPALPEPTAGEPSREIPEDTAPRFSWVPTINIKNVPEKLSAFWWPTDEKTYVPHVRQALSLVPDECLAFHELHSPLYVSDVNDLMACRSISRAQMELLAARVSALNECFY